MTITCSLEFYTDFAHSEKLNDLFFNFDISELQNRISELFDQYYKVDDELSLAIDNADSDEKIQELKGRIGENNTRLDHQLELIDELFCLHIYKRHIEQSITEDELKSLHQHILKEIDDLEHAEREEDYQEVRGRLNQWRKTTASLSRVSIPGRVSDKETKLGRCIEKAKHLAQYIPKLEKSPRRTINKVYFLYKERSFHGIRFTSVDPVAVLKGCKKTNAFFHIRQSTSWMEVIAYEAAETLGLARLFTPTTITTVESEESEYEGCIQPFIKGDSLYTFMENDDCFPDLSRTEGLIAGMIMGLYDAHCENIIINRDAEVQYFDNSRSLPHSNRVIRRNNGTLLPTFRNHLLIDRSVFEPFDLESIELIEKCVADAQKNTALLKERLTATLAERSLPKNWLDPELAVAAMEERLESMSQKIKIASNMLDFIFDVNPYFKFYVSLVLAHQYYKHEADLFTYFPDRDNYPNPELMENLFIKLFYKRHQGFRIIVNKCKLAKINPLEIWKISQEKSYWGDWLIDILDYVDTVLFPEDEELEPEQISKQDALERGAAIVMRDLEAAAVPDFKDPNYKDT